MPETSTHVEPMAQGILDFWFGPVGADGQVSEEKKQRWFTKDAAFDALIRKRYEEDANLAMMGAFDRWTLSPLATVALVVLLDQFPRNMYRGSFKAFAYDKKALATAWVALDAGVHLKVPSVMAYFIVMPTMHAELLDVQDRGVAVFTELLSRAPAAQKELLASGLRYARMHRDIIARFGRFPHRNEGLERPSTEAELAFLKQPGSSF